MLCGGVDDMDGGLYDGTAGDCEGAQFLSFPALLWRCAVMDNGTFIAVPPLAERNSLRASPLIFAYEITYATLTPHYCGLVL